MDLNKPYVKYTYDYVTLDVALLKNKVSFLHPLNIQPFNQCHLYFKEEEERIMCSYLFLLRRKGSTEKMKSHSWDHILKIIWH